MAIKFASASTQYVINTATPVTGVPLTVGMWFQGATSASLETLWALNDTASADNAFVLLKNGSNLIAAGLYNVSTYAEAIGATGITSNGWTYVVARYISATSRRVSILHATGLIEHASNTTSVTPLSIDAALIGANMYSGAAAEGYNGAIAEYWMSSADIQADGAQLQNSTLRTLAYCGPFALPHIARNIVHYRSFYSSLDSRSDRPNEVYVGAGKTRETWTATNGPTLVAHAPLSSAYVRLGTQPVNVLV